LLDEVVGIEIIVSSSSSLKLSNKFYEPLVGRSVLLYLMYLLIASARVKIYKKYANALQIIAEKIVSLNPAKLNSTKDSAGLLMVGEVYMQIKTTFICI
jgi:hypothetical protein